MPPDLILVDTDALLNELKRRSDTFFYSFYFAERQDGVTEEGDPIIRYENKCGIATVTPELSADLAGNMLAGLQFIKKGD